MTCENKIQTETEMPHTNKKAKTTKRNLSYEERIELTSHPMAKQMLQVITAKQSNLCVAADLLTCQEVLQLAEVR